jgi:hypothetical protein
MGVKVTAVGTLRAAPRPWGQGVTFEMDCPTKTTPPKGLPAPAGLPVTVLCSLKAWRSVQAEVVQEARLIAEGEPCPDGPAAAELDGLSIVALKLATLPPKEGEGSAAEVAATVALPTIPPPATPGRQPYQVVRGHISPADARSAWEAEDGRCEACGRPMAWHCAYFARLGAAPGRPFTADNVHLLCVDCKFRQPDPLVEATIADVVADAVSKRLGRPTSDAADWLRQQLLAHAVLVQYHRTTRRYWLPGVGTFALATPENAAAAITAAAWRGDHLDVIVRPQARTRSLPRPDRAPDPAEAVMPIEHQE